MAMASKISHIDSSSFEREVLQNDLPVIVDFYSEDCPPCEQLAPIYERLSEKYGDQIRFVKIFRQKNRDLALSYGVKGSPTVLFFKDGKEVGERLTGYIGKPQLRQAIEAVLGTSLIEPPVETVECDTLILGGGPAGLSAAIYSSRSRLNTILLEEGLVGGQAATTYKIENYPGFARPISGKDLMNAMKEQALIQGAKIQDLTEILEVDLKGELKRVRTEDAEYRARSVIIATGAEPRKLPAEGEADFRGRGVHYCATCDGAMYQDLKVLVIGGGNSAVEEAVYLTRFASSVTIVHEFDHLQASRAAQEEAFNHPKIDFVWESHVQKLLGNGHLEGVAVKHLKTGQYSTLPADGVFVYIGNSPRTSWFKGIIEMDDNGYIIADESLATSVPGVFVAGDVRQKGVRQVVTAAADGAIAAISAERYLSSK